MTCRRSRCHPFAYSCTRRRPWKLLFWKAKEKTTRLLRSFLLLKSASFLLVTHIVLWALSHVFSLLLFLGEHYITSRPIPLLRMAAGIPGIAGITLTFGPWLMDRMACLRPLPAPWRFHPRDKSLSVRTGSTVMLTNWRLLKKWIICALFLQILFYFL